LTSRRFHFDAKERGEGWRILMAVVRQDIEEGIALSFGAFIGEANGYEVYEGAGLELGKQTHLFSVPQLVCYPFTSPP
jgi:hypothetical protein